jgi:hypothetical protein
MVPGVAKNARNPEIVDQELSCLQFMTDDQILATLLVFPCHPEVLWKQNPQITSDYPGYLRLAVEQVTGAPCLFFAGALGGMMTPDVRDHSFQEAEAMGKTLADYHMAIRAGLLPDILDENSQVTTEANLLKIGEVWLAGVPGELLPKLGLQIKDELRRAGAKLPVIVGLANDELGYILPDEDFIYPQDPFQPGDHYEETNSIGPNIGSLLMAQVQSLLRM